MPVRKLAIFWVRQLGSCHQQVKIRPNRRFGNCHKPFKNCFFKFIKLRLTVPIIPGFLRQPSGEFMSNMSLLSDQIVAITEEINILIPIHYYFVT
jgi:hypothetical protein